MNRLALLTLWLLTISLSSAPVATLGAQELSADIRFAAQAEGTIWMGEEVELALDLFSNGFSFSGQLFQLPEVTGAYLLQADSTTVKLSETRDGEAWQGLRYSIRAYPQREGVIEIPSFEVVFSVSSGYGSEPSTFRFETPVLRIQAELPPGADRSRLVVSSTDYSMNYQWSPSVIDGEPLNLKTGDALTLTVERRADSVPGMVFPDLPEFQVSGLQAYHDAPAIMDRVNRGSLTGIRSDSVSLICERAGQFEIPSISFQSWDPEREVMTEMTVPGLSLVVEINPAFENPDAVSQRAGGVINWRKGGVILLGLLMVSVLFWKVGPVVRAWAVTRKRASEQTESWAFRQVQTNCRSGDVRDTDRSITLWLSRFPTGSPRGIPKTLTELAKESGQESLILEVRIFQSAIVAPESSTWSGNQLAALLEEWRNAQLKQAKQDDRLPPLNPVS